MTKQPPKRINKNAIVTQIQFVEFQLLSYFFIKYPLLKFSSTELRCLSELALRENVDSVRFYEDMVDQEVFKNPQSTRNFINRMIKDKFIIKENRLIRLNIPDIETENPAVFTISLGLL